MPSALIPLPNKAIVSNTILLVVSIVLTPLSPRAEAQALATSISPYGASSPKSANVSSLALYKAS